jgi:DNA polymerase-4
MVEKLAFQLRSEEWLTSTVVIRYSNFDTKQSNAGSIHFCRSYFDKKRDGIIRQAIPTSHAIALIGIRFSGLVRGTYQINMFEDTEKCYRSIRRWIE